MNVLFFLTPKASCAFIDSDDTIREAMGRMEASGYSALPVLSKDGRFCGTLTEGDLLWAMKNVCNFDLKESQRHGIAEIQTRRQLSPVTVEAHIEDLIIRASEQNFVPVVDDKGAFIGIVRRSSILKYCAEKYFKTV